MAYFPREELANQSLEEQVKSLRAELYEIAKAFNVTDMLQLTVMYRAPERPRNGMLVYADGVSWNPGSGEGFYGYVAGAWVSL